jgi:RNA polymerase sigma-70 factor (sigma-E family)
MTHERAVVMTESSPAGERWAADEALERLYAAHWRSLVRFGVLLLRDQGAAEEVVQDAFIAMHGRWGRLRDPDRALGYLRRSVVNGARSTMRHRGVVSRHVASSRPSEPGPAADTSVLASERRAAVLDALDLLPSRQREVLVCRYFLDLSEAEIAETLGISRGAVKSHASRGSAALRATLADHWTQEDLS